jgi:peptide chain release factor 1
MRVIKNGGLLLTKIRFSWTIRQPILLNRFSTVKRLHPLLVQKAQQIHNEYHELSNEISLGTASFDPAKATKLSRLMTIANRFDEYRAVESEFEELQPLLNDPSLRSEAETELEQIRNSLGELTDALQGELVPSNPFIDKACFLELRPGIGGSEAMLFTNDLLQMYQNYCLQKKWPFKIISLSKTATNGVTEAILSIDEPGSYERLQYEGGVHRVQRVPETETKGRVHTSTAAVVVLPQLNNAENGDEAERNFAQGEVRIDVMRSRGAGGQHVNTTESAVRLTHIPTGIVVSMQDERSQHKNKAKAFTILCARIAEKERIQRVNEERSKRTAQVTTTDRSDKIRTYNYPQNRITDHRCGYSSHKLEEVMSGQKFDEIIDAMDKHAKTEKIREIVGTAL